MVRYRSRHEEIDQQHRPVLINYVKAGHDIESEAGGRGKLARAWVDFVVFIVAYIPKASVSILVVLETSPHEYSLGTVRVGL